MKMLEGKNAVVTGCMQGIGMKTMEVFAQEGANVWAFCYQPTDELETKIKTLQEECGVWIKPIYFDMADEEAIKNALKQVMGGFLILVSLYFFFVSGRIHLPPTMPVQIGMGTLSGVLGGLFAMQGPPAVIYFVESCKSKEEYIAATQWYFLIGNAAMSLFRADSGFVTPVVLRCWCFAMPAVLAGMWIGSHIYKRIRLPLLRKVVYAYMALAGLISIIL